MFCILWAIWRALDPENLKTTEITNQGEIPGHPKKIQQDRCRAGRHSEARMVEHSKPAFLGGSCSTCTGGKNKEPWKDFSTSRSWGNALYPLACLPPPPAQPISVHQLHTCGVHPAPSCEPEEPALSDEWKTAMGKTDKIAWLWYLAWDQSSC